MNRVQADDFLPKSKYLWCLHCNQVDMRTGWVFNNGSCPYEGCSGGAFDAMKWSMIRGDNPDYPKVPDYDVRYPIYR